MNTTLTFGYSRSISVLLAVCALFFILVPLSFPYVTRDLAAPTFKDFLFFWSFSAVALIAAVSIGFYKIELAPAHLTYGLFFRNTIYFPDVKLVRYRSGPRLDTIDIVTRQGRTVSFTSSIARFGEFFTELQQRAGAFGAQ